MAMNTGKDLFKKINISSIVVIAVVISSIIFFLSANEKEKSSRIKIQNDLNTVTKEKITLEDELRKTNTEKTILEETVNKLNSKMDVLTKDLDTEKSTSQELNAKLKEKEKESESLKTELTSLKKEKDRMETKISEATLKIKTLELSLNQLQAVKADLERKVDNIMNKRLEVELEKVVIKPKPGIARILAVNNSYGFVVINLGEQHSMEEGRIMGVYRGAELIAKVKIQKIYETMSVADIIFEASPGIIREEDTVKEISSDVPPDASRQ